VVSMPVVYPAPAALHATACARLPRTGSPWARPTPACL
ncbi:MAG: hypothetical protein AVDCRST_MAG47-950, partial [uncultured Nocardioidaceae bacterium]